MKKNEIIKKFIKDRNIHAEILYFKDTVESVEAASKASGIPPEKIVKTLLVKVNGEIIAVLIPGNNRLDYKKLKKVTNSKRVRLLYPHEVKNISGFRIGEVSPLTPLFTKLKVIADRKIQDLDVVLVGGGTLKSLVKIKVKELIRVIDPLITDVTK
ncbi:MAG: YbaK/EbsC family protein [archaeon GB-1867-035]|nr:YbaK/EbsC family protein [Candidatus Culexmicrobium profundum]